MPKTLVFTQSKDSTWKIFHLLQLSAAKKDYVMMYHANLTPQTKMLIQQLFSGAQSTLRCIVAQLLLGWYVHLSYMYQEVVGYAMMCKFQRMDIPDVEVVVVYSIPKTATQLYQVVILLQSMHWLSCLLF